MGATKRGGQAAQLFVTKTTWAQVTWSNWIAAKLDVAPSRIVRWVQSGQSGTPAWMVAALEKLAPKERALIEKSLSEAWRASKSGHVPTSWKRLAWWKCWAAPAGTGAAWNWTKAA